MALRTVSPRLTAVNGIVAGVDPLSHDREPGLLLLYSGPFFGRRGPLLWSRAGPAPVGACFVETLVSSAREVGVELDARQQALFRRYFELLDEGARTAGVTAVRGWTRVRDELLLRSLRLVPALGERTPQGRPLNVIDVGAGGGIPGLVLKLVLPEMDLTLLDATRKKTDFLSRTVSDLELDDVRVVWARAETAAHEPKHRERYDVVVVRSVARLAELAELTLPFCRVGGAVIAVKQQEVAVEVREASWAAGQLGAAAAEVRTVTAPGPAPADALVIWTKVSPTPGRFPRRAGLPHKRPLAPPRGRGRTPAA